MRAEGTRCRFRTPPSHPCGLFWLPRARLCGPAPIILRCFDACVSPVPPVCLCLLVPSPPVWQVGELVFGSLGGVSVVLMRGRFHFYEGYAPSRVSLPIRVFAALGVRVVVVTNASGGVNPGYDIGDFMVISDHLSFPGLSGVNPLVCVCGCGCVCV